MIDIKIIIEQALEILIKNRDILKLPVRSEKSLWSLLSKHFYGNQTKYMTVNDIS